MLKKLTILILCIQFNAEAQTSALAIGDSLFANGKYTRAIEQYQNHPNQNEVYDRIAKAYLAIGNFGKALENYRKSSEANPDNALIKFEYAKLLSRSKKYNEAFSAFKKDFGPQRQSNSLKMIRNNKKLHFYLNSGTVKLSTIHSFKGWESETIVLILENFNFQLTFDEILYTGITRSRANLILINYGNKDYNDKLKKLVEQVK